MKCKKGTVRVPFCYSLSDANILKLLIEKNIMLSSVLPAPHFDATFKDTI
jgi:hypothetical protein